MKTSKKIILSALSVAAISGAGFFSQNVFAQSPKDIDNLAAKIATKLNVKESDVKSILTEYRLEKQAEREAKLTEELDKAVTEGRLTVEQKTKITAKRQEIKTRFEEINKITDKAEIQKAHKQLREEVKAWAKANAIELRWLRASGHAHHMHKDIKRPMQ